MGLLSNLFLNRGVVVVLESSDSSRAIAYSKPTFLLNIPLMMLIGMGLRPINVPEIAKMAIIFVTSVALIEGAHLRSIRLPPHQALEWKNAHKEWISGGSAPSHPDAVEYIDFFKDYTKY